MNWKSQNEPEASYSYTKLVEGKDNTMGNEWTHAHSLLCATDTVIKWTGNERGKNKTLLLQWTIMNIIPTPTPKQRIRRQEDGYIHAHNQWNKQQRAASSLTYHITSRVVMLCETNVEKDKYYTNMYECISTKNTYYYYEQMISKGMRMNW